MERSVRSAVADSSADDKIRVTDQEVSDKGNTNNVRIIEDQRDNGVTLMDLGDEADIENGDKAPSDDGEKYSDDQNHDSEERKESDKDRNQEDVDAQDGEDRDELQDKNIDNRHEEQKDIHDNADSVKDHNKVEDGGVDDDVDY